MIHNSINCFCFQFKGKEQTEPGLHQPQQQQLQQQQPQQQLLLLQLRNVNNFYHFKLSLQKTLFVSTECTTRISV